MRTGELGFWWHSLGGPPAAAPPLRAPTARRTWRSSAPASRDCGRPTTSSARDAVAADRRARARDRRLRRLRAQRRMGRRASSRAPPRALRARSAPRAARGAAARRCSRPSMRSRRVLDRHAHRRRLRQGRPPRRWRSTARRLARLREERRRGARAAASARRTCASCPPTELARARTRRRRARRELLARTSRACTRRSCSRGLAAAVEELGVRSTSSTPVAAIAPARSAHAGRRASRRAGSCARPRATRPSLRGLAPRARADEQLDDRHRAAGGGGLGGDRLGGQRGARRRRPRVRLPAADRRRAHRDRRARRALPLRLAHRRRGDDGAARPCASLHAKLARDVPRRRGRRASTTRGRACSACRATGACRSTPTPPAGLARAGGYVGEGVAASNLAGADAARPDPRRAQRADGACRGSGATRAAGSPSRCAGPGSAPSTRSTAGPTAVERTQRPALAPGRAASTRCLGPRLSE